MFSSQELRARRKSRQRFKKKSTSPDKFRLCVHRSNKHTYAQIIDDQKGITLVSANTMMAEVKDLKNGGNKEAAILIGKLIAEKAKKEKVNEVVFDRSGFLYHGRIKALADSAREHGLKF